MANDAVNIGGVAIENYEIGCAENTEEDGGALDGGSWGGIIGFTPSFMSMVLQVSFKYCTVSLVNSFLRSGHIQNGNARSGTSPRVSCRWPKPLQWNWLNDAWLCGRQAVQRQYGHRWG